MKTLQFNNFGDERIILEGNKNKCRHRLKGRKYKRWYVGSLERK